MKPFSLRIPPPKIGLNEIFNPWVLEDILIGWWSEKFAGLAVYRSNRRRYKTTKSRNHQTTTSQDNKITKPQNHTTTKSYNHKITKSQNHKTTKPQNHKTTKSQKHKIAKPHNYKTTKITKPRNHTTTKSQNLKTTKTIKPPKPTKSQNHTTTKSLIYVIEKGRFKTSVIHKHVYFWRVRFRN